MKQQLINKIKQGYEIKIINCIDLKSEVLRIKKSYSELMDIDGMIHIIKRDYKNIINLIIENTFYNPGQCQLTKYKQCNDKKIIIIKFNCMI